MITSRNIPPKMQLVIFHALGNSMTTSISPFGLSLMTLPAPHRAVQTPPSVSRQSPSGQPCSLPKSPKNSRRLLIDPEALPLFKGCTGTYHVVVVQINALVPTVGEIPILSTFTKRLSLHLLPTIDPCHSISAGDSLLDGLRLDCTLCKCKHPSVVRSVCLAHGSRQKASCRIHHAFVESLLSRLKWDSTNHFHFYRFILS